MTEKLSVLVVDDEDADRYILIRKLRSTGLAFDVIEARDGREAIGFFEDYQKSRKKLGEKFPPIIIFLDINMPLLNGFEFLDSFEKIRAEQSAYLGCVIMMFSSSERPEDRERAFSKDFVKDYIVKGKTAPDEIRAKVDKAVEFFRQHQD